VHTRPVPEVSSGSRPFIPSAKTNLYINNNANKAANGTDNDLLNDTQHRDINSIISETHIKPELIDDEPRILSQSPTEPPSPSHRVVYIDPNPPLTWLLHQGRNAVANRAGYTSYNNLVASFSDRDPHGKACKTLRKWAKKHCKKDKMFRKMAKKVCSRYQAGMLKRINGVRDNKFEFELGDWEQLANTGGKKGRLVWELFKRDGLV